MHHQVRIAYNLTGNSSALVASFRLSLHEYTSTADHDTHQNTARMYVCMYVCIYIIIMYVHGVGAAPRAPWRVRLTFDLRHSACT